MARFARRFRLAAAGSSPTPLHQFARLSPCCTRKRRSRCGLRTWSRMQQADRAAPRPCTRRATSQPGSSSLARAAPQGQRAPRESSTPRRSARGMRHLRPGGAGAENVESRFDANAPVPIRAQPLVIREIVGNLLDNAIRYAGPGSTVTVQRAAGVLPAWCAVVEVTVQASPFARAEPGSSSVFFYGFPGPPGAARGLGLSIVREFAVGARRLPVHLLDGSKRSRGLRAEVRFPPGARSERRRARGRPASGPI